MRPWPFDPLRMFGYDLGQIDPPWPFDLRSRAGEAKSPQAQYDVMTLAEIAELPVGDLLAPGGALVMWCTWPLVARGDHVAVARGWGLVPVTGGVWAKRTASGRLRWGTGYVIRSVCEPFLIMTLPCAGIRGRAIANMIETVEDASLDGLAREHSRKPDEVYDLLERLAPDARRCDVFARQRRPGWDGWGRELGKFDREEAS